MKKKLLAIALVVCMAMGLVPYTAFATEDEGNLNTCDHLWNGLFFSWQEDYSCVATRSCINCEQIEEITCVVTRSETKATCTDDGEYVYTASAYIENESYVDEKYVDIKAKGHTYNGNICKVCGATLLSKPTLVAKSNGLKQIKLTWKAVKNAEGYRIQRATAKNGKYVNIKTVTASTKSYIDKNREAGKTYFYRLVAYKGTAKNTSLIVSAKSGLSKPVMKTTATSTVSSIKISWTKVTSAKGYYVYRKTSNGSWKKIATIKSGTVTNYNDKGVSGVYQYAVKAYTNIDGKVIYSDRADAVKSRTLKAPTIKVAGLDSLQNKITWKKVTGATGYEIYFKVGENGSWKKGSAVGNVTSYVTKTVNHGVYYYYKVRPIYKNGNTITRGTFSNIDNRIHYYYPNVVSFMTNKTDPRCGAVALNLENNGVGKIRIYSKGAELIDNDYYSYDRDLKLCNTNGYTCNYLDIAAGSDKTFGFYVVGDDTWYDEKTKIKFKMYYDGIYYWCYVSSKYGFNYYEID